MDNIPHELIEFLKLFIDKQAQAHTAYIHQDIKKLNFLTNELNSFGTQHLHDCYGVSPQKKVDEKVLEIYADDQSACLPAHLFLVRKYYYQAYGDLFRAYLSHVNPYQKSFSVCYFLTEKKGVYIIISKYVFNENRKKNQPEWENCGGDDLDLSRLGKGKAELKIMAPTDNDKHLRDFGL